MLTCRQFPSMTSLVKLLQSMQAALVVILESKAQLHRHHQAYPSRRLPLLKDGVPPPRLRSRITTTAAATMLQRFFRRHHSTQQPRRHHRAFQTIPKSTREAATPRAFHPTLAIAKWQLRSATTRTAHMLPKTRQEKRSMPTKAVMLRA